MTPFLHDEENPFARTSAWPSMPQAPLRVARARTVLGLGVSELEADEAPLQRAPQPGHSPRRERRLTPLIGAAAVGLAGLLTLFLLIGPGPAQP